MRGGGTARTPASARPGPPVRPAASARPALPASPPTSAGRTAVERPYGLETATVGELPGGCLRERAAGFLRSLRPQEAGAADAAASAANTPRIAASTAYVLGALHTHQRHRVAAARADFEELWHRCSPTPTTPR